jgi:hypothetical protein
LPVWNKNLTNWRIKMKSTNQISFTFEKKITMKQIIFILICILFIFPGIYGQDAKKTDTKPIKLSKHQIEILQSDAYAYAEADCRYEFSKMKLAKNADNQMLINEMTYNRQLLAEVVELGQKKYSDATLSVMYLNARDEANGKLPTCIRASKLKEQNKLEEIPKK